MSTAEYRHRAKEILKGKYGEAFIVTLMCLLVFGGFKVFDLLTGTVAVLWDLSDTFFYSGSVLHCVLRVLRFALCLCAMSPVLTGGVWWYFQTAGDDDNRSILKLYSGVRLNLRAVKVYGIMWLCGFLSILPCAVLWCVGGMLVDYAYTAMNQSVPMFLALQCFVIGFFSLGIWIRTAASLAVAPFLFVRHPDMGAFKIIWRSGKIMRGRKTEFVKLLLGFVPSMLPVVTIPFMLPRAAMAAAVFARKSMEECCE